MYSGMKRAEPLSLAQKMAILLAEADLALAVTDRERAVLVIADIFDLLDAKAGRGRGDAGRPAGHRTSSAYDRPDQGRPGERACGVLPLAKVPCGSHRGDTALFRSVSRR